MTPNLLHQLLAYSARSYPDQVAVSDHAQQLTYSALASAAQQLAQTLNSHGVSGGDRVGIYLEKSAEAVIALFGILFAGATYVPLDPAAPVKRIAFMTNNCQMKGLITTRDKFTKLEPALPQPVPCLVMVDNKQFYVLSEAEGAILSGEAKSSDLAYILYTSGSTGEPKGVMLSHRAALSFVSWAVEYFQLQPGERIANHAPLHFDLSIFDIFAAVAVGATVVLVPSAVTVFPRSLADWIDRWQINVWYSVPAALTQLVLHGGLERYAFSHLHTVLFAGEVFPIKYLRQLLGYIPHARYYNLYGPTETNVCTVYDVPAPPLEQSEPLPIGQACANCVVIAVDKQQQPITPGETGELYVSGPSLMNGYWGLAEKTAEVLLPLTIPHTQHATSNSSWYRTGDLVRLDADGNYHFVGRRDAQIKSRGYRIELGEIESVLHRHSTIAEAVVLALPEEQAGHLLKAVIVPHVGSYASQSELLAFCAEHLPSYMIPTQFEVRSALPKTSTGKIDRQGLQAQFLIPRNPLARDER